MRSNSKRKRRSKTLLPKCRRGPVDMTQPLGRDEIHAQFRLRGLTLEQFAAKKGFNYFELARLVRTGNTGRPGTKTWEMAEAVALELRQPFKRVWGISEVDF